MGKLSYILRYNLKKAAIDFQTYRFERQIRRAYGMQGFSMPSLAVPSFITSHPIASLAVPVLAALSILGVFYLPRPALPDLSAIGEKAASFFTTREAAPAVPPPAPRKVSKKPDKFMNTLVADKKNRLLHVVRYYADGQIETAKTYKMAIGANWGRKEKRGDLKTPEGFYWLINVFEDRELPPIYGVRSFVTDYPNEQDVAEGRTGTGIWIHGVETGKSPDKTKGCLELSNEDLQDITSSIGIGTPLVICETTASLPDTIRKYFNWEALVAKRDEVVLKSQAREEFFTSFIEKWRVAWESKDIDQYSSFYGEDFVQDNMAFPQWRAYKKAIFLQSPGISVTVSNVRVVKMGADTAEIAFQQEYESGAYLTKSSKLLRLVRRNNDWKITEEIKYTSN